MRAEATDETDVGGYSPDHGEGLGMTVKERLHQLIEELPERQLSEAEYMLQTLHAHGDDPLARKLLLATIDDEPETEEERVAVQEARDALARGDVVRDEDLARELGW